jgi:hypothetical protein
MHHNTVKFVVEENIKFKAFSSDTFDADVDFPLDNMDILTGVEGYYVGKRCVFEYCRLTSARNESEQKT